MPSHQSPNIACLLPAAGGSSRLGRAKQLEPIAGETVIERITHKIRQNGLHHLLVVTGKYDLEIRSLLEGQDITIKTNQNWSEGMGSSIAFGVTEIQRRWPETDGILIHLTDQPFIPTEHIASLLNLFKQHHSEKIVATAFSNTFGPPALFPKSFFKQLSELRGDTGAKKIITQNIQEVISVPCKEAAHDIDKEQDIRR